SCALKSTLRASSGSMAKWRACRSASSAAAASRCSSENRRISTSGIRRRTIALAQMPKTLTGAELQLDDGPARDAELFLVDGNNRAYRAFFALPEAPATTDGVPTNALLGSTHRLLKVLGD